MTTPPSSTRTSETRTADFSRRRAEARRSSQFPNRFLAPRSCWRSRLCVVQDVKDLPRQRPEPHPRHEYRRRIGVNLGRAVGSVRIGFVLHFLFFRLPLPL